uniref:Uncharacterized protein n=1 Tax=Rhizophora mucronata TaxID=61149 RepID=A0A2P2Q162_RHIMU
MQLLYYILLVNEAFYKLLHRVFGITTFLLLIHRFVCCLLYI